jgi:hypothetical protein
MKDAKSGKAIPSAKMNVVSIPPSVMNGSPES